MRVFSHFHHWNLMVLGLLFVTLTGCRVWNRTHVTSAETLASRQYVQRAAESLEQQNEEDAESQLNEALNSNPSNFEARTMKAEILWKQGKKKEATAEMEKAVTSPEVTPEQITRLAQMHFDQGDFQKAQNCVSLSFRYDASLSSTWVLQGEIYEIQGRNEDALAAYHQAAFHEPEDSRIQLKIASTYLKIGKPQRALETVQHARLKGSTEDAPPEMLLCESKALTELNRTTDAVRLLMIARQKNPENAEIQTALAQLQPFQAPTLVNPGTRYGSEIKILPKPERTDH
ncbi:MAG: tetratricopeptide repeat protein [Thermoguttaceae bacterium]|nr:tetratricopeptide repeat protein [Thermoguttaceae bacterium]